MCNCLLLGCQGRGLFFFFLKCLFLWDWVSVYFCCLAPFPCHRRSPRENFQAGRLSPCPPTPPGQSPNRYKRSASLSEAAPLWLGPAAHHHHRTRACQRPVDLSTRVSSCTHAEAGQRNTSHPPQGFIGPWPRAPNAWRCHDRGHRL